MASKTSDAVYYKIKIGKYTINVIDTPGFGDCRGPDTDDEHFLKIKKVVEEAKGINSIVVVQNGREARLHAQL